MTHNGIIKIIDYKAGNAPSVLHAVERLGFLAEFASKPEDLKNAGCIILPGVGSAGATMRSLQEAGMTCALTEYVLERKVPFLGVCIGMQILFEHSEEENALCFGWLKGHVVKFNSDIVRVPQMGWNKVHFVNDSPLSVMPHYPADSYFYFVNSFYAKPENPDDVWGTALYGADFAAAVRKDNIYGTQFHIEKSGEAGLKLLKGFIESC